MIRPSVKSGTCSHPTSHGRESIIQFPSRYLCLYTGGDYIQHASPANSCPVGRWVGIPVRSKKQIPVNAPHLANKAGTLRKGAMTSTTQNMRCSQANSGTRSISNLYNHGRTQVGCINAEAPGIPYQLGCVVAKSEGISAQNSFIDHNGQ